MDLVDTLQREKDELRSRLSEPEDAPRESERRLRYALAAAGAGIWDWDIQTGTIYWTEELFRLFGLDPAEVEPGFDPWRGAIHPDDRQGAEERVEQSLAAHAPLSSEYRIVLPSASTTYGEDGTPLRMSGICLDITDRMQAEAALSESERTKAALRDNEQRLRVLIDASPVAIGFGDSTGRILEANESFYRLTGYTREEIEALRIGWDRLTAPEYAEMDRRMMAALAATGSAGPYEKEYIRKDGRRVPLLLSVSRLPGRDEHAAFILVAPRYAAEHPDVVRREPSRVRGAEGHAADLSDVPPVRASRRPAIRRGEVDRGPRRGTLRHRTPPPRGWTREMGAREGVPRIRRRRYAARRLRDHAGYHRAETGRRGDASRGGRAEGRRRGQG